MNEERRRAIVAEVARWSKPNEMQPWHFTAYDYMEETGLSRTRTATRLSALVRSGRLRSEVITHQGKRMRVYWRPEDEVGE